jgi:hypothetical protein
MSDVQGTYATLMEVDKLLADIELRIEKITSGIGAESGGSGGSGSLSLRKELMIINTSIMAIQKFTGNDTLAAVGNRIQEVTAVAMRLFVVLKAIEIAEAGTLGPLGWAYAGAQGLGLAMTLSNLGQ